MVVEYFVLMERNFFSFQSILAKKEGRRGGREFTCAALHQQKTADRWTTGETLFTLLCELAATNSTS